jgi:hypothetical protein
MWQIVVFLESSGSHALGSTAPAETQLNGVLSPPSAPSPPAALPPPAALSPLLPRTAALWSPAAPGPHPARETKPAKQSN